MNDLDSSFTMSRFYLIHWQVGRFVNHNILPRTPSTLKFAFSLTVPDSSATLYHHSPRSGISLFCQILSCFFGALCSKLLRLVDKLILDLFSGWQHTENVAFPLFHQQIFENKDQQAVLLPFRTLSSGESTL